jgi:hypothetical protein
VIWSPKRFSPIERGGERAPHEECGYKKARSPRGFSPKEENKKEHLEKSVS